MAIQVDKIWAEIRGPERVKILEAFIQLEESGFLAALQQQTAVDVLALARSVGIDDSANPELKYASMEFSVVSNIVESFKKILDNNTERKREES